MGWKYFPRKKKGGGGLIQRENVGKGKGRGEEGGGKKGGKTRNFLFQKLGANGGVHLSERSSIRVPEEGEKHFGQ